MAYLEIDHQNLRFNQANVTLAWRGYFDENCTPNYTTVESYPIVDVESLTCGNLISVNAATDHNITLPQYSSSGQQLLFKIKPQFDEGSECTMTLPDPHVIQPNVTFGCKFYCIAIYNHLH